MRLILPIVLVTFVLSSAAIPPSSASGVCQEVGSGYHCVGTNAKGETCVAAYRNNEPSEGPYHRNSTITTEACLIDTTNP